MRIKAESEQLVSKTRTVYGWSENIGIYALASVYNSLAAADAECSGTEAGIMIPANTPGTKKVFCEEADASPPARPSAGRLAYGIEKALRKTCGQRNIELNSVKIIQNPLLSLPAVTITGAGRASPKELRRRKPGQAGEEIVLVKWIAMEGMLQIMDEKEEELRRRFAPAFIRQIQSRKKELFAGKELKIAKDAGAGAVRQITEGGIFAALWNLAKETETGLCLDMKRISILQETVEVCEHYRLNPYQLASAGSFLMLTENSKMLTDALHENQTAASVIGRLTQGNDKVIYNGRDIRYIDRPAPDEIYKLFL